VTIDGGTGYFFISYLSRALCYQEASQMNLLRESSLAAVAFFVASSIAFAQAPITDGKGCTPQERSNKALEHDQSNAGVICPPEINSGMIAPVPKAGDTSVTPPGVRGDDPSGQQK
jgi:hypothetical protein